MPAPWATRLPGSEREGVIASGDGRGQRATGLCGRVHVPVILSSPSRVTTVEVPRWGPVPGTLFLPFARRVPVPGRSRASAGAAGRPSSAPALPSSSAPSSRAP